MKTLHVHCDQRTRDFLEITPCENEVNGGPGLVVNTHEFSAGGGGYNSAAVTYDRASVEELIEKLEIWLEETK